MSAESTAVPASGTTTVSDPRVAEALRPLDTLAEIDLSEHVGVFERLHGALQQTLTSIDDATGSDTGGSAEAPGPRPGQPPRRD